jgi:hypothetical protein
MAICYPFFDPKGHYGNMMASTIDQKTLQKNVLLLDAKKVVPPGTEIMIGETTEYLTQIDPFEKKEIPYIFWRYPYSEEIANRPNVKNIRKVIL